MSWQSPVSIVLDYRSHAQRIDVYTCPLVTLWPSKSERERKIDGSWNHWVSEVNTSESHESNNNVSSLREHMLVRLELTHCIWIIAWYSSLLFDHNRFASDFLSHRYYSHSFLCSRLNLQTHYIKLPVKKLMKYWFVFYNVSILC